MWDGYPRGPKPCNLTMFPNSKHMSWFEKEYLYVHRLILNFLIKIPFEGIPHFDIIYIIIYIYNAFVLILNTRRKSWFTGFAHIWDHRIELFSSWVDGSYSSAATAVGFLHLALLIRRLTRGCACNAKHVEGMGTHHVWIFFGNKY